MIMSHEEVNSSNDPFEIYVFCPHPRARVETHACRPMLSKIVVSGIFRHLVMSSKQMANLWM